MADLDAVVAGAIAEATGGDSGSEDTGTLDTGTGTGEAGAEGQVASSVETGGVGETPPALDDIDTMLSEHGVKPPIEGQRENRLPYSRVRKIIEKATKEAEAKHTQALEKLKGELTPAQQRAQILDSLERLATSDPEGYIRLLAKENPAYAKFLQQQAAAPPPPENDPEPQPDVDGGFSREGLSKWGEWMARKGEQRAIDTLSKRFGPIEEAWKATQKQQEMAPLIRRQREEIEKTFGAERIQAHRDEIAKALTDDFEQAKKDRRPQTPAELIVARILLPKIDAAAAKTEAQYREQWRKEQQDRKVAAASADPAASTSTAKPSGPRNLEDVVRDAVSAISR